jgi:hypothetical protein
VSARVWLAVGGLGVGVALAGACHHRQTVPQVSPADSAGNKVDVTGVVHVVGTEPRPVVVLDMAGGGQLSLVGTWRGELAQLQGATVRVTGSFATGQSPYSEGVDVTSYDIVEVAGAKPVVGVLAQRDSMYSVDTTRLASPPIELAQLVGAKVWVVGRAGSGGLIVTAYGILAPAPRDSVPQHQPPLPAR